MLIIREAKEEDISKILKLFNDLIYSIKYVTEDDYFDFQELSLEKRYEYIRMYIHSEDSKAIVVLEKNKIIGFILAEIKDGFLKVSKIKKIGYISAAYILKEYRNKKVLKKLLEEIENFFKEKEIGYLELHVLSKNIIAKKNMAVPRI